jgi:hypothetical protein
VTLNDFVEGQGKLNVNNHNEINLEENELELNLNGSNTTFVDINVNINNESHMLNMKFENIAATVDEVQHDTNCANCKQWRTCLPTRNKKHQCKYFRSNFIKDIAKMQTLYSFSEFN